MSNVEKKLPKDEDQLKAIAESTDNPQMKRAIEKRLERKSEDNTVNKNG